MRAKKTVCFLSMLLLFPMLTFSVDASSNATVSFRGSGVTIDLTYPEEARPNATITYNVTITATTEVTSINIGIFIYAPVNSTLQLAKSQPFNWGILHENQSLPTSEIPIQLPEQANGTLYCNMTVQTEIASTPHYSAYSFYTTLVSDPTFSEMRVLYDEMLANYTSLKDAYETLFNNYTETYTNYTNLLADYETLLGKYNQLVADNETLWDDYNELSANYNSLNATYMALLSEHNQLTKDYNNKVSDYDILDDNFRVKNTELGNLQTIYSALNDTYYSLQTNFNNLQIDSSTLNQTYNNLLTELADLQSQLTNSQDSVNVGNIVMFIFVVAVAALIAFIIYIKRKQEDPYLVIRKETVSMKSDEDS